MWIKSATRKEFLEIVDQGQMSEPTRLMETPTISMALYGSDELQLVWRDKVVGRPGLPNAVLIAEEKRSDFLAWVLTYLPSFRPLTAFCRVVDVAAAEASLRRQHPPTLGKLEDACLGLILTEAATYVEGRLDPRNLSPNACASTFSFAVARALALGILKNSTEPIGGAWSATRNITRQFKLRLTPEQSAEPWGVLLFLAETDNLTTKVESAPQLSKACWSIYKKGDIQPEQWEALTRDFPEIRSVKEQMRGPREDRVTLFEKSLESLLRTKSSNESHAAFVCGYLASQIGPGAIDHLSLLTPCIQSMPTTLLWYGLCAGLQQSSKLQSYADGLGRRVLRDVLENESFLDRPRSDIALPELQIITRTEGNKMEFHVGTRGYLEVEVAPCVYSIVRWSARDDLLWNQHATTTDIADTRALLGELDDALRRIEHLRGRLARLLGFQETSRNKYERRDRKASR